MSNKSLLRTEIISRSITFNSSNKVLLVSSNGETWHFPGGMLDGIESLEKCAERETFEETGLKVKIKNLKATADSLRDCRKEFQNFLRTVTFYFFAKTDADSFNENHCDIDNCIKHKKFFSENEFLSIKKFFPIQLQMNFSSLLKKDFIHLQYEMFLDEDLKNSQKDLQEYILNI